MTGKEVKIAQAQQEQLIRKCKLVSVIEHLNSYAPPEPTTELDLIALVECAAIHARKEIERRGEQNDSLRKQLNNSIPIDFYNIEKDPIGDVMVRTHDGQFCRRADLEAMTKQYHDACTSENLAVAHTTALRDNLARARTLLSAAKRVIDELRAMKDGCTLYLNDALKAYDEAGSGKH